MISDAKKASNARWDKDNMPTLCCKMRREDADAIRQRAKQDGKTVSGMIADLLHNYMSCGCGAVQCATSASSSSGYSLPSDTLNAAQRAAEAAGQDINVWLSNAVTTQAKRDTVARRMQAVAAPKHAPDQSHDNKD